MANGYQTQHCIIHRSRQATHFTGHVHKGRQMITAGWCGSHGYKELSKTFKLDRYCPGCHGDWKPSMGIMEPRIYKGKEAHVAIMKTVLLLDDIKTIKQIISNFLNPTL